jgi:hypothetical protein
MTQPVTARQDARPEEAHAPSEPGAQDDGERQREPAVRDISEVVRLATMIQALHEEVRHLELDDSARRRLVDVHRRAVDAIAAQLSTDLRSELTEVVGALDDRDMSSGDLRVMHAALTGWLQGLFQGLQAAAFVGRMAMQQPGAAAPPELPPSRAQMGQYL